MSWASGESEEVRAASEVEEVQAAGEANEGEASSEADDGRAASEAEEDRAAILIGGDDNCGSDDDSVRNFGLRRGQLGF